MARDVDQPETPPQPAPSAGRNVIAVIGIDRYPRWPRLSNAVNDALGMRRLFQGLGFEELAPPLLDGDATADAIRHLVTGVLVTLRPDDSLVVFFAGHGHTQTHHFEDGHIAKTGYIIPVGADGADGRVATWLRLDSWLSDIAHLPARHILVVLDACHSGIALGALIKWRGGNAAAASTPFDELRRRRSRRVIVSALDDQRAMDGGPVPGHSLFTGCFIEALNGGLTGTGPTITGSQLGAYVQQRVSTYPSSQQTPDFGSLEFDNRGELCVDVGSIAPPRSSQVPPIPDPPRRRRRGVAIAGAAMVVVAGSIVVGMQWSDEEPVPVALSAAATIDARALEPDAAVADAPATTADAPAPERPVQVVFETQPRATRAVIFVGGKKIAGTRVELPRSASQLTVRIEAPGFHPYDSHLVPSGDLTIVARLRKRSTKEATTEPEKRLIKTIP
jgi:hypothetical protein